MWALPRPKTEPVPPALAGGFSTTGPPEKSSFVHFKVRVFAFRDCLKEFWQIQSLTSGHFSSGCRWRAGAVTSEQREPIIVFFPPSFFFFKETHF